MKIDRNAQSANPQWVLEWISLASGIGSSGRKIVRCYNDAMKYVLWKVYIYAVYMPRRYPADEQSKAVFPFNGRYSTLSICASNCPRILTKLPCCYCSRWDKTGQVEAVQTHTVVDNRAKLKPSNQTSEAKHARTHQPMRTGLFRDGQWLSGAGPAWISCAS